MLHAGSSAPLLNSWPLMWPDVRAWAVPTAPLVFLACSPWGRPCTQHSWLGVRVFCLCVVRVVTVTKPLATWPSIWPGWWLRHPQPGKGSLKCVEVAVLGLGCSDGVGTHRALTLRLPLPQQPSGPPGAPFLPNKKISGVPQACSYGGHHTGITQQRLGTVCPALLPTSSTYQILPCLPQTPEPGAFMGPHLSWTLVQSPMLILSNASSPTSSCLRRGHQGHLFRTKERSGQSLA